MTAEQKRAYVSSLYSSPGWKRQVANMSDSRITAIYLRYQNDGKKYTETTMTTIPPVESESRLDIPPSGLGPHANEDEFDSY